MNVKHQEVQECRIVEARTRSTGEGELDEVVRGYWWK